MSVCGQWQAQGPRKEMIVLLKGKNTFQINAICVGEMGAAVGRGGVKLAPDQPVTLGTRSHQK